MMIMMKLVLLLLLQAPLDAADLLIAAELSWRHRGSVGIRFFVFNIKFNLIR